MIDVEKIRQSIRDQDWKSAYATLDDARNEATTDEDRMREVHWRSFALEQQQRHGEALDLLRDNAHVYRSKSLVQHQISCLLLQLGRDQEALDELSKAPFEAEMTSCYGLAIDAKFFYLYLLAKSGDSSVKERLPEIPDNYRHITMDGDFLTKPDIVALLNRL